MLSVLPLSCGSNIVSIIPADMTGSFLGSNIENFVPGAIDSTFVDNGSYLAWKGVDDIINQVILPTLKGDQLQINVTDWIKKINTAISDIEATAIQTVVNMLLSCIPIDKLDNIVKSSDAGKYIVTVLTYGFTSFEKVISLELNKHSNLSNVTSASKVNKAKTKTKEVKFSIVLQ